MLVLSWIWLVVANIYQYKIPMHAKSVSIHWPENIKNEVFILIQVDHEKPTVSVINNFVFEELQEDKKIKLTMEKCLCESISRFMTITAVLVYICDETVKFPVSIIPDNVSLNNLVCTIYKTLMIFSL
jgi:hypothetical protein